MKPNTNARPRRRTTATSIAVCALLALPSYLAPVVAAAAAPMTMSFYCTANVQKARTLYLTGIFSAAVEKRDVISAWKLYLESQHIDPSLAPSCEAAVDAAGVKPLMDLSRASAANIKFRVIDVDWKFANQVPVSDPNMMYGYCQSGTSVANATYFSDVFGMSRLDVLQRVQAATPFVQYVRAKYGDPPGLAVGTGPGPRGEWCTMIGNIADAERDKKSWVDKLRSPTRQIVETGWRYGQTPMPSTPAAPAAAAAQGVAATSSVAATPAAAAQNPQGWSYFCTATSGNHQYTYYTRIHPLDAHQQDVRDAWRKYVSPSHTPGIVETQGTANCVTGITAGVESGLSNSRGIAERNAASVPSAGFRVIDVDWKFTPDQLAEVSKPGATYGFCWYQNAAKSLTYVSGTFEMPDADIRSGNVVMYGEFAKDLKKKHGVAAGPYDPRVGACVPQSNATTAEQNRQKTVAEFRQKGSQVAETGWKFVRTAETPPPGPSTQVEH